MKINIELKGLEDMIGNLKDYETAKKNDVSNVIKETAFKIQANAKLRTPVLTGHLKRNIKVDISPDEMSAEIGTKENDVEYAKYVEFGTKNTHAQPFLFPAFEDEKPEYLRKLKEAFSDVR